MALDGGGLVVREVDDAGEAGKVLHPAAHLPAPVAPVEGTGFREEPLAEELAAGADREPLAGGRALDDGRKKRRLRCAWGDLGREGVSFVEMIGGTWRLDLLRENAALHYGSFPGRSGLVYLPAASVCPCNSRVAAVEVSHIILLDSEVQRRRKFSPGISIASLNEGASIAAP